MGKRWRHIGGVVVSLLLSVTMLVGCGSSTSATSSTSSEETSASTAEGPNTSSEAGEAVQETGTSSSESTSTSHSSALQKYIDRGYITIGTSNDAPMSYVDQSTGEWTGIDGKIITEACKRLGIKEVKVEIMDFANLIVALNSNKIDMICDCMMITDERLKQAYFSDYVYQNSELLVVPSDSSIKSKDDFTGNEVIGCTDGTTFLAVAQKWQQEGLIKEARAMGDQSELLLNVQTGKIDGCLTDAFVMEYLMNNKDAATEGLKLAEDYTPEGAQGNAYACRFSDEDMMKEFNTVFKDLRSEGFIDKTMDQFGLSKDIHCITQDEAEHNLNIK